MPILIIPRTPILMRRNRRRERRMVVRRDNITTKATMGIMVSAKQIVQILWLTPIHRVMVNVVKESRPQEGQSPVLIRSA